MFWTRIAGSEAGFSFGLDNMATPSGWALGDDSLRVVPNAGLRISPDCISSTDLRHHREGLLAVHFGIDLRDDRRRMAEDDAGHVQAVLFPEPRRGVVPKLVGMPVGNLGLIAGVGDGVGVGRCSVAATWGPLRLSLPSAG